MCESRQMFIFVFYKTEADLNHGVVMVFGWPMFKKIAHVTLTQLLILSHAAPAAGAMCESNPLFIYLFKPI